MEIISNFDQFKDHPGNMIGSQNQQNRPRNQKICFPARKENKNNNTPMDPKKFKFSIKSLKRAQSCCSANTLKDFRIRIPLKTSKQPNSSRSPLKHPSKHFRLNKSISKVPTGKAKRRQKIMKPIMARNLSKPRLIKMSSSKFKSCEDVSKINKNNSKQPKVAIFGRNPAKNWSEKFKTYHQIQGILNSNNSKSSKNQTAQRSDTGSKESVDSLAKDIFKIMNRMDDPGTPEYLINKSYKSRGVVEGAKARAVRCLNNSKKSIFTSLVSRRQLGEGRPRPLRRGQFS